MVGIYLNPGAGRFLTARSSKIYVDKTALLGELDAVFGTEQRFVCVSRPRRFGKTMAANMVCAYYDRTVADEVFDGLAIAASPDFARYRGACDVLRINMQEFLSRAQDVSGLLSRLRRIVLRDLLRAYPDVDYFDREDLVECMQDIYQETHRPFVIVIDEWDCIFREYPHDTAAQRKYLDFLRDWLKDKAYIGLSYMTGILPVSLSRNTARTRRSICSRNIRWRIRARLRRMSDSQEMKFVISARSMVWISESAAPGMMAIPSRTVSMYLARKA